MKKRLVKKQSGTVKPTDVTQPKRRPDRKEPCEARIERDDPRELQDALDEIYDEDVFYEDRHAVRKARSHEIAPDDATDSGEVGDDENEAEEYAENTGDGPDTIRLDKAVRRDDPADTAIATCSAAHLPPPGCMKASEQAVPDPFDPAALRLPQDYAGTIGVKRVLTRVRCGKPEKHDFVRVRPGEEWRL